jgi:cyclopropane-fatty-acyl-phospholipid synthase
MRIRREAFFDRLGADGVIGFGEGYLAEDWTSDGDLAELLSPFAARTATHLPAWTQRLRRFYVQRQPSDEENTRGGAKSNIHRHYDLSNDLFSLFLDESMTYSSALFAPGDSLEDAQRRKIDRLLDATGVGPGTRLLEIGTGWGALAIRAAERGAIVSTITLSGEQQALARERAAKAGVADRVDVALCDYRDARGTYDAVVSVEMIEAVGDRFWPTFFTSIDRVLAPGGAVGIQAILQSHDRFLATRGQYTWMNKYIFPGGVLVSVPAVDQILRRDTGLRITEQLAFGRSYAATLHEWRRRFVARADAVEALGFDPTFRRMWELYLAYSEAGFGSGHLDVAQLVLRRDTV